MPRIMLTRNMLSRLILEFRSIIDDPDYVPPDYAGARNQREKWEMAVNHIKEALFGVGHDPDTVKLLNRDRSISGMKAAFGFSSKFAKYVSEDYIRVHLIEAFGEGNVVATGPGPKPEYLSGTYKTWRIILPDGTLFRAMFKVDVKPTETYNDRGVPTYHGHKAEGDQINAMNAEIAKAIGNGTEGITIDLGGKKIENVGAVIKILKGCPKSDAYFVPMRNGLIIPDINHALAHISLKNAANPSGMNQWAGALGFATEKEISNVIKDSKEDSKEFAKELGFVERLKKALENNPNPNEFPLGMAYRSAYPLSHNLAQKMCWGKDWPSGKSGINSVDMIYVSTTSGVELVKNGEVYYFKGVLALYDGMIPPGGWEPYLWARRGDRNDFGIKNCRIGAFPKEYRSGRFQII